MAAVLFDTGDNSPRHHNRMILNGKHMTKTNLKHSIPLHSGGTVAGAAAAGSGLLFTSDYSTLPIKSSAGVYPKKYISSSLSSSSSVTTILASTQPQYSFNQSHMQLEQHHYQQQQQQHQFQFQQQQQQFAQQQQHHQQQQQQHFKYPLYTQTAPIPKYQHHPHQHHHHQHNKRKSAVELLAESKPFYVKSETVLERQQQLSYRASGSAISPSRVPFSQSSQATNVAVASAAAAATAPRPRSSKLNRRSTSSSSSSDLLQTKLRNLLDSAVISSATTNDNTNETSGTPLPPPLFMGTLSDLPSSTSTTKSDFGQQYLSPKKINQDLLFKLIGGKTDLSHHFQLPPQGHHHPSSDEDIYSYNHMNDSMGMGMDDYGTISPPAEYAEIDSMKVRTPITSRFSGYQRSYSHSPSQVITIDDVDISSLNLNSHKSLPDLHSQICRQSPHSEVLSCGSRGNRSTKSGSTFNRDSGGSSGHYTHRSEPYGKQQYQHYQSAYYPPLLPPIHLPSQQQQQQPPQPPPPSSGPIMSKAKHADYRRDSGSSTQHSSSSYYPFDVPSGIQQQQQQSQHPIHECVECHANLQEAQEQEEEYDSNCLFNFTTLEVPEAFQDNFDATKGKKKTQSGYVSQEPLHYTQKNEQQTELSPPLGTFKRQRCFRVKQRDRYFSPAATITSADRHSSSRDTDRRPILRSKSDICDRNRQRPIRIYSPPPSPPSRADAVPVAAPPQQQQPLSLSQLPPTLPPLPTFATSKHQYNNNMKIPLAGGNQMSTTADDAGQMPLSNPYASDSESDLELFFEHLGLNEMAYDQFVLHTTRPLATDSNQSSPVFFSDASTIDSNRMVSTATVNDNTQPAMPPLKPSEPPSIVERNARIVKWLCNCRKSNLIM